MTDVPNARAEGHEDLQRLPKRQAGAQPSGRNDGYCGSAVKEACARTDPPRRGPRLASSARADGFDLVEGCPNRGDIANHASVGKGRERPSDLHENRLKRTPESLFRVADHALYTPGDEAVRTNQQRAVVGQAIGLRERRLGILDIIAADDMRGDRKAGKPPSDGARSLAPRIAARRGQENECVAEEVERGHLPPGSLEPDVRGA